MRMVLPGRTLCSVSTERHPGRNVNIAPISVSGSLQTGTISAA